MKKLLSASLLALSSVVSAYDYNWESYDAVDDMTDLHQYTAITYADKEDSNRIKEYEFGVRCDVVGKEKMFIFFFSGPDVISTPNSRMTVKVKIDSNDVLDYKGRMFTNSYQSGFMYPIDADTSKLVSQMRKGNNMKVRIANIRRSNIVNYSVSLSGFSKESATAVKLCGVFK